MASGRVPKTQRTRRLPDGEDEDMNERMVHAGCWLGYVASPCALSI